MRGYIIGERRNSSVGIGAFSVYRRGIFFIDKTKVGNLTFERGVGRIQLFGGNIASCQFFKSFVYFCRKTAFIESCPVIDEFVLFVNRDFPDESYCSLSSYRRVFGYEIIVQL